MEVLHPIQARRQKRLCKQVEETAQYIAQTLQTESENGGIHTYEFTAGKLMRKFPVTVSEYFKKIDGRVEELLGDSALAGAIHVDLEASRSASQETVYVDSEAAPSGCPSNWYPDFKPELTVVLSPNGIVH